MSHYFYHLTGKSKNSGINFACQFLNTFMKKEEKKGNYVCPLLTKGLTFTSSELIGFN